MNLQDLQDKINKLSNDMGEMLKSDMDGEQEIRFDRMDTDRDRLMKQRDRLIKMGDVEAKLAEPEERRSQPSDPRVTSRIVGAGSVTSDDVMNATRAWLLAGNGDLTPELRSAATKVGIDPYAKRISLGMPSQPMTWPAGQRSLTHDHINEWEKRALGTTPGSAGGFTVPDEIIRSLEEALLSFGGSRQVASVIRTGTGAPLPWPTANDTTNTGEIVAESGSFGASVDPTFGLITFGAYKYSSKPVLVPLELLQDSAVNLGSFLGNALGTRIGRIQNTHFTTGDNSSKPNGIVTASTQGVSAAVSSITYDNVVDLVHSVGSAYRSGARFMFADSTLQYLRKLKAANFSGDTQGTLLWQPGMAAGVPDRILGYEYVINDDVADIGASAKSMVFGDLSKYMIRDAGQIEFVRLNELYMANGQIGFLAYLRSDGDLLDAGTNPVKHLVHAAA